MQASSVLPPSADALFASAGRENLFASKPWFEAFLAAGLTPGAEPLFFMADSPRALLPCQRLAHGDPSVSSLTSFYSCDFRPLIAPGDDAAFLLGRSVAERLSGEAVFGFDSLATDWLGLDPFLKGLARPGRALLRYAHFGRWWDDVRGRSFDDYLAARDGALREVIRRKTARMERDGAALSMIGPNSSPGEVEAGIADYQTVYAASWKEAEPFPDFQPTLMRKLAEAGWLRLALLHQDRQPIAAQLWTLVGGTATVLKLAHDQRFDKQSPGTVLTAFAIRTLMTGETVERLDFGRGDDPYKRGWTTRRTPHIGVRSVSLARRPLTVARHLLGTVVRGVRARGAQD
ncbi:MAG TPA: GNAT family N-acetyltransferase [Alphaproteobacteria bacterium]|nr:GNAT family N-acetyltransferase [Alphaproteobacteria bacterium]